jgi:ketosteroid isomerase-like protein
MLRIAARTRIVCLTLLGLIVFMSRTGSAQSSDIEQVKAANQAYYAALSARDIAAMERVWAPTTQAVNIAPPIRPAAHAGWDAVKKNYVGFWGTLDELTVSMSDPAIQVHGSVAWVYGIEQSKRRAKDGTISAGSNFGTSIFIKDGHRWLMVFHQAALIPAPR